MLAIPSDLTQTQRVTVGPVLRRNPFPRAVRQALQLKADTFAFLADPHLKPADIKSGRDLWADRGGLPPLAVVSVPADQDDVLAAATAGVQMALAAGAGAAVLERATDVRPGQSPVRGLPPDRDVLTAVARQAPGLPLLYAVQPGDVDDAAFPEWLEQALPAGGWLLDPGALYAAGWWNVQRLDALGRRLQALRRPGAIWVQEPQSATPDAPATALGLGGMGLNGWWDVLARPWAGTVPLYVEVPPQGTIGAELHSLRKLVTVARARSQPLGSAK